MRLPTFLIIGAMKAGTTTLYNDLKRQAFIFLPDCKEPNALIDDQILTRSGQIRYSSLFRHARDDQICGEASTAYAKLPHHRNAASRARQILGSNLRVIYIVRDPVLRLVSHYRHDWSLGLIKSDLRTALDEYPDLISFSCYAS